METAFAVLTLIAMGMFCAAMAYWIITMSQIRKTAKVFEAFLSHADETAVVLSQASQKAAGTLPLFIGLASVVKNQFFKKANGAAKQEIKVG